MQPLTPYNPLMQTNPSPIAAVMLLVGGWFMRVLGHVPMILSCVASVLAAVHYVQLIKKNAKK